MTPCLIFDNALNSILAYTVNLGKMALRFSVCRKDTNFAYLLFCKFCFWMIHSTRSAFWIHGCLKLIAFSNAVFCNHIIIINLMIADEKVRWIDTCRRVAGMAHQYIRGQFSNGQFPGNVRSATHTPISRAWAISMYLPVSRCVKAANPNPASFSFVDLFPEPFWPRFTWFENSSSPFVVWTIVPQT